MFGSTTLEIVIGLLFIYLLYSLLATVIAELIGTFLGLRARNLTRAISRMLEDDNKKGKLTKAFYAQPVIKYLAPGKMFKKPSYIAPDNFAKGIMETIKDMGDGRSDLEKIKSVLENTISEENQKFNALKRLLEDKGISGQQQLDVIKTILNSPVDANAFSSTETGKFIKSLLDDAQQDLEKFKALLEKWFNDTMDRAVGWYKRNMQLILLAIGLLIAISFNASTFQIVKFLARDKTAREQMVQLASSYIENNPGITDSIYNLPEDAEKKLDTLLSIRDDLKADIDNANNLLGLGWKLPDSLSVSLHNKGEKIPGNARILINGKDTFLLMYPDASTAKLDKGYYKLKSVSKGEKPEEIKTWYASLNGRRYFLDTLKRNFWGYLVTALAISLGAPFWFDLLNKLVKLRSSVQQPSTGEAGKSKKTETITVLERKG